MTRRSRADKQHSHELILAAAAEQLRLGGPDSVSVNALMRQVGLTHGGFYKHFASREALLQAAIRRAAAPSSSLFGAGLMADVEAGRSDAQTATSISEAAEIDASLRPGRGGSDGAVQAAGMAPNLAASPDEASSAAVAAQARATPTDSRSSGRSQAAAAVSRYLSRSHRDNLAAGCAIAALAADMARLADADASQPVRDLAERGFQRLQAALGEGASRDDAIFIWSAMVGGLMLARVFGETPTSEEVLQATRGQLLHWLAAPG